MGKKNNNMGKNIKNLFSSGIKDMKKATKTINNGGRKSLKARYK